MDLDRDTVLCEQKKAKRRAYGGMCKVTILLFAFSVASFLLYSFEQLFANTVHYLIQRCVVSVLTVTGLEKTYAISVAKELLLSESAEVFSSMISTFVCVALPAMIFAAATRLNRNDCFNVNGKLIGGVIAVLCFTDIVTSMATTFSGGIYDYLLPTATMTGTGVEPLPAGETGVDIFAFVLRVLHVAILVPIVEEFAFRGVVFTYLRRYGTVFAVVASAVVFGAAHSSPVQSSYAMVFGLVSALLVTVTGNIKTSILCHAAVNLCSLFIQYAPLAVGDEIFDLVYLIFTVFSYCFGFVGLYLFVKKDGYINRFSDIAKKNDEGLACSCGMAQIAVAPFVVYVVFYALGFLGIAL